MRLGTVVRPLFLSEGRRRVVAAVLLGLLGWAILWQGGAWLAARQVAATVPQGENILRLAVSGLRGELARYERLPDLMARTSVLGAALAPDASRAEVAAANLYLRHVTSMMGLSDAYIMDRGGTTVAASNFDQPLSFIGETFDYRPYFRSALDGGTGRFFALGTTSGKRGYYFGAAVHDRGRVVGVLALKVDMDAIEDSWRAAEYEIIVTDSEGIVFLASRRDWHFRSLAPLTSEARARIAATRRYGGQPLQALPLRPTSDVAGHQLLRLDAGGARREFVSVAETMPEADWTVQVLLDTAPARRQAQLAAAAGLLIVGATLAALMAWMQRRARLRERLSIQAEAQAQLEERVSARTLELARVNARLEAEVTERRLTEAELRRTQRHLVQSAKLAALGQMSATLSHELSQPLGAVRNFAANAMTYIDRQRVPEARDNIARILTLADRMTEIGRTLRNFARKPNAQLSDVDLHEVLRDAQEVIAWRIGKQPVDLQVDLPPGPLIVRAGAVRLQQVIVNLLSNALDALDGRPDALIRVTAEAASDRIALIVSDNGPGIPAELEERIFDPFFSTKGVGSGLGLGLSISYNIIRDFGGELRLVRRSGGAGFRLDLPRPGKGR
ncbi:sensor histidine kinase [Paracoccus beibuensis]|uniref:sensor histidine kinase n=1 Tax=Paracoccus beibuensis TaxID=547602 RepID=UPI00223ECE3F|nr:ATP-binding protein [Paracoccus beibuensis]